MPAKTPEEILSEDAAEWKKRAVAAEAKVDELNRLFALSVLPEFPFFDQTTKKLKVPLTIRERAALGAVATLSLNPLVIEVEKDQPLAAKHVGLLFQLLQIADVAALESGSTAPMVSPQWIQDRAPALLVLLLATNLANPRLGIEPADVAALEAKDAPAPSGS